jgi:hypothetical protein
LRGFISQKIYHYEVKQEELLYHQQEQAASGEPKSKILSLKAYLQRLDLPCCSFAGTFFRSGLFFLLAGLMIYPETKWKSE